MKKHHEKATMFFLFPSIKLMQIQENNPIPRISNSQPAGKEPCHPSFIAFGLEDSRLHLGQRTALCSDMGRFQVGAWVEGTSAAQLSHGKLTAVKYTMGPQSLHV